MFSLVLNDTEFLFSICRWFCRQESLTPCSRIQRASYAESDYSREASRPPDHRRDILYTLYNRSGVV